MSHHCLELTPIDLLFFKDGRPMEGASSGCGAAWPLPNVISSALHHALHRASHEGVHSHTPKRNGSELSEKRDRQFGSLQSAGPFPVDDQGRWLFPRPADAQKPGDAKVTHRPLRKLIPGTASSLPDKLLPVVSSLPPSKERPEPWITAEAYQDYLDPSREPSDLEGHFLRDDELFGAQHQIGIGMSPETGTQDGERFYSASYLRLREKIRMGVIATCMDKGTSGSIPENDLIAATFPNSGKETRILAGGQQRVCTVTRTTPQRLPLPLGVELEGTRVKWTLLTPAVFPRILEDSDKNIPHHPGGWLPTWVDTNYEVQLKDPKESLRQSGEGRSTWRKRVADLPRIQAKLVAAILSRPIPVTGWALQDADGRGTGGARATHLAVPAGSVYYFECDTPEAANQLASALNWHGGPSSDRTIVNRRSTLLGEKGFGLGVCSGWQ